MAKSKITIDLDKLSSAIAEYDDIITNFEQAVRDSERAINSLKNSGWKSGASTAYFLTYEDTWKKNMQKRIKIIKHLRDCLKKAYTEYTDIYEEMQQLDSAL